MSFLLSGPGCLAWTGEQRLSGQALSAEQELHQCRPAVGEASSRRGPPSFWLTWALWPRGLQLRAQGHWKSQAHTVLAGVKSG